MPVQAIQALRGGKNPFFWIRKDGGAEYTIDDPDTIARVLGLWQPMREVSERQPNRGDGYPNRVWSWVDTVPTDHTVVVGHDWLDRVNNCVTLKTGAQGGEVYVVDCGSSKGGRLGSVVIDVASRSVTPQYWDM